MKIASCVRVEMSKQEEWQRRAEHPEWDCERWRIVTTSEVSDPSRIALSGCIPRIDQADPDPERQAYLVQVDITRNPANALAFDALLWWQPTSC